MYVHTSDDRKANETQGSFYSQPTLQTESHTHVHTLSLLLFIHPSTFPDVMKRCTFNNEPLASQDTKKATNTIKQGGWSMRHKADPLMLLLCGTCWTPCC